MPFTLHRTWLAISFSFSVSLGATSSAGAGVLYAVDGTTQTIVKLDAATGAVLGSLPTPAPASGGADGLAAAGNELFFVSAASNVIHVLAADTGVALRAFPAPPETTGVDGLAVVDGVLYALDPATDTIVRVDPATGASLGSCATGLFAVGGLGGESGRLFALVELVAIVELDPSSCAVLGGPFAAPAGEFLLGLAFDGTRLYASGFPSGRIFALDPETGAVLDEFDAGFVASGLAASAPAEPAPGPELAVDIEPGSCTNPVNLDARGLLPVAVYGTEALDVSQLDVGSLRLAGVAPRHARYADVGGGEACDLPLPDGKLDATLKFSLPELKNTLEALGVTLEPGTALALELAGRLLDGSPVAGSDTVRVLRRGGPARSAGREPRAAQTRRGLNASADP